MTIVSLYEIEEVAARRLKKLGRGVKSNKIGRLTATVAMGHLGSRSFPDELYPFIFDHDLSCAFGCHLSACFFHRILSVKPVIIEVTNDNL
jgi:hypothetical protein